MNQSLPVKFNNVIITDGIIDYFSNDTGAINENRPPIFAKASGVARFSYNWALNEWQKQYEACQTDDSLSKPSQAALRRQLNAINESSFRGCLK